MEANLRQLRHVAILRQKEVEMTWIKTADKLPPKEIYFLAFVTNPEDGDSWIDFLSLEDWDDTMQVFSNDYHAFPVECVTYWMPLPEPPKEMPENEDAKQLFIEAWNDWKPPVFDDFIHLFEFANLAGLKGEKLFELELKPLGYCCDDPLNQSGAIVCKTKKGGL